MFTFPLNLKAGTVTIKNNATYPKTLNIYVPNKDSIPMSVPAGAEVSVKTLSAGESFMYLSQADKELTVEISEDTSDESNEQTDSPIE